MEGYIDVHSHILPGLDDGAGDMETARRMLETAYGEGIRSIIATPHHYAARKSASVEKIRQTVKLLEEKMQQWQIEIRLYEGNEIYYRSEVPELLEKGEINTLAGSRYVLVEFDPMTEYSYLRDGVLKLASYGYVPVLAHTERYECLFEKKERLERIRDHGAILQVNAGSFQGGLFSEPGKRARYLMKNDLFSLLGTDAHSPGGRSPRIRETALYLERKLGKERAGKILYENPAGLLQDREIR